MIKSWCKKKLVFACPHLPLGTVMEGIAHCTHLQSRTSQLTTQALQKSMIFAKRFLYICKL